MKQEKLVLTQTLIQRYTFHLKEQERADATIQKYTYNLNLLCKYLNGAPLTKIALIEWKQQLAETYAPTSVNSMLAAVNGLLTFLNRRDLIVKLLKIQRSLFLDEDKELTRNEYIRLVRTAQKQKNQRLSLVLQTICSTGIRVSELRFITAEAVYCGKVEIINKGKRRTIFLPDKLRRILKNYLQKQKRTAGAVFTTKSGNPLDRSNIWREMKKLCESAGVAPGKVFPHNLRHLFARTFYSLEQDLSRLADILGHSNINTTRIYTAESGFFHAKKIQRLGLIIT